MSHVHADTPFVPLGMAGLTVSDTRGVAEDGSGDLLEQRLSGAGHTLVERCIVPDDVYRIRAVVSAWVVRDEIQANGGTGFTPRDTTPGLLELFEARATLDMLGAASRPHGHLIIDADTPVEEGHVCGYCPGAQLLD